MGESTNFVMYTTDENLVVSKRQGKSVALNTHHAIFKGSDGVEYLRPKGNVFVALTSTGLKGRREKTTLRGTSHVYPHRTEHLPANLRTKS
jgi:hypothetical protein